MLDFLHRVHVTSAHRWPADVTARSILIVSAIKYMILLLVRRVKRCFGKGKSSFVLIEFKNVIGFCLDRKMFRYRIKVLVARMRGPFIIPNGKAA